jgi:enterochelin esterase-like enzyme
MNRTEIIALFCTAACFIAGATHGQSSRTNVSLPQAVSLAGGTIRPQSIFSKRLGRDIDYQLYLPAGYDSTAADRYPVLYLLHGRGDNMSAWFTIKAELDEAIRTGRVRPVIAVMPDAPSSQRAGYYVDSQFTGSADLQAGAPMESAFTIDLVAHVDATYRTRPERSGRIVGGYSMGGFGALRYALAHPELFGAAIVLSPAVYVPLPPHDSSTRAFGAFGRGPRPFDEDTYRAANYPALIPKFAAKGLPLVMFIAVGDDEQALADPTEASHDLDFEAHAFYNQIRRVPGIKAQFRVVDGGHNWDTWRPMFVEGLGYVFSQLPVTRPEK